MNGSAAKNTTAKKEFKMIHVFALLFIITAISSVLTYILPAGEYAREVLENGRTAVIANSYAEIPRQPVNLWGLFQAVVKGWSSANSMIFLTFFVGAAVKILEDTGLITNALNGVMQKVKGKEEVAIILTSIVFSLLGGTGAFSNAVIAVVPIGILFARRLGYDGLVGFGITYASTFTGFAAGWANVFTTVISQGIAELPQLSGFPVRVGEHVIFLFIFLFFLVRYARKIKRDQSLCVSTCTAIVADKLDETITHKLSISQKLAGATMGVGFLALIIGSMKYGFGFTQMSAVFLIMGVVGGIVGGLGINGTAKSFVEGCKNMCYAALIIGMAKAISVVLTDGKIIDTLIYYLSLPINNVGPVVGANVMFLVNLVFNFVITSGSGQALTVMPIMVPIADLCHITRQVACEAFKLGDALSNLVVPTAGIMMASISMAGVSYTKWLKWFMPVFIIEVIVSCIILTIAQLLNWGPF